MTHQTPTYSLLIEPDEDGGYLAYFPALWFRVMDPRLLRSVGKDPSRINFQPARRESLVRKHSLREATGSVT